MCSTGAIAQSYTIIERMYHLWGMNKVKKLWFIVLEYTHVMSRGFDVLNCLSLSGVLNDRVIRRDRFEYGSVGGTDKRGRVCYTADSFSKITH